MMEREVTEQQWLRRVQHMVQRRRAILNRSMYGSTPIDISSFDTSAPLHALHPCRKMLQLLQQHVRLSPTLQQMWMRYTELESIENWRQVASLDAHDFAVILYTIHTQYHDTSKFIQGSHWTIPRPREHMWRQTFHLDSVIGITPGHTAARRVACTVPAEKLMGGVQEPQWIFQSPEACRCLWLIQPDARTPLLDALSTRMRKPQTHTSVIVLCPQTHHLDVTLNNWCNIHPTNCCVIFTGSVNTLPLLRDHSHKHTNAAPISLTAFWVTVKRDDMVTMNDITSHIGMQTRCIHGTYTPPPQDMCLPSDKTALRRDFWNRWDTLTNEARHAHRWPQHKWVTHLNAMNQLLAIAPCRWLRRLYAFCKKPFLPLDTQGTWIYAVWSVKTQRVYIGHTGGIGQLKRAIVRFMQHMRAARSWHTLYGRRGIRGMGLLYPTMFRLGPENFGVVILEACPKNAADARELFWIRKMGRTLNVRGVNPTDRRWKLLLNGHMIMPKYTKAQLARMTHHITDKLKCNVPIHVQLKILIWAKKHFQGPIRNRCYQKVAHRVKSIIGLSLPNHVPLRIPAMSSTHTFPFKNLFKDFLRSVPIPLHYRDYLVHSTRLISTRNPTVSQLLQDNIKYDTVDDMRQAAAATCRCHTLAKRLNIPLVEGHLFIRHPKLLRRVFGTDSRVLLQHGNNDVCPTWQSVRKSVVKSARDVLTRLLPERIADAKASQFYSSLLSCARQCWQTQHIMAPWYAWEQCVRAVREKWTPQWVFEGCDKNMGKIAAVCRVGMLQRTLADLQDQQQFEVLHIAPSTRDARTWAMQHIRNQAALHGIDKSWTTGAKKGPSTMRDVPKNKLDELKNWRVTPQHLCIDIIPSHLWHATIWPFLNDTVALWSLCVPNTYMLGWTVRNVMQTIRFEPWDGIYWRLRRLICRIVNNARHLPAHWGTAQRLLSPLRPIQWKTRLVFSHYRHPLRARGRHISRCLQMLITE